MGLTVPRDAVIATCADVMGLDLDELRAEDAARLARFAAAKAARGRKGEIDALAALRPRKDEYGGKGGLTFDDDAATMLAESWSRLGGAEFGKKIFGGIKSLHLANFGPLSDLSGLDAAADVKTLTMKLTPDCDLSPIAKLAKLDDLQLCGNVEGFAPLAALPKLISLATEANERGIEELAAVPKLRVLTLFVAKNVRVGGLLRLSLKSLNRLDLFAGEREIDADLIDTVAALAKRKGKLRLCGGETWTTAPALIERIGAGSVSLDAGSGYSLISMRSGGYAPIPRSRAEATPHREAPTNSRDQKTQPRDAASCCRERIPHSLTEEGKLAALVGPDWTRLPTEIARLYGMARLRRGSATMSTGAAGQDAACLREGVWAPKSGSAPNLLRR